MSHLKAIAEFSFITNKSYLGRGHPITIPSRFYHALKESGLADSTPALVSFADGAPIVGSIHIGWRAGGKYYQVRMNAPENHDLTRLKQGVNLHIRLLKGAEDWNIEVQRKS
jgi:hypothetical protein